MKDSDLMNTYDVDLTKNNRYSKVGSQSNMINK